MIAPFIPFILDKTKADNLEIEEIIQELWSGYGKIIRLRLEGSELKSVVVKLIHFPKQTEKHPRGWNTALSHQRKVKSYQVEIEWYKHWAQKCTVQSRVPKFYGSMQIGDRQLMILEDINDSGYFPVYNNLSNQQIKNCIQWLANFHALFMHKTPKNLWEQGNYWHLKTRPDEFNKIQDVDLKSNASKIDELLYNAKYKTIIHGDAKVANFCFSSSTVAAVDFQYVGGGIGVNDLAYFLGSCLDEKACFDKVQFYLNYYFEKLKLVLNDSINKCDLEEEWRLLFPVAWTDFTRFLVGWVPSHQKINAFSQLMKEQTLQILR